jgi:hypothetical protein
MAEGRLRFTAIWRVIKVRWICASDPPFIEANPRGTGFAAGLSGNDKAVARQAGIR